VIGLSRTKMCLDCPSNFSVDETQAVSLISADSITTFCHHPTIFPVISLFGLRSSLPPIVHEIDTTCSKPSLRDHKKFFLELKIPTTVLSTPFVRNVVPPKRLDQILHVLLSLETHTCMVTFPPNFYEISETIIQIRRIE